MRKPKQMIIAALLALWSIPAYTGAALGQDAHPAVDVSNGCLLGGVSEGRWLEDVKIAPMLKGGERYTLYNLEGPVGEVVGEKPESAGPPCTETRMIKLSAAADRGFAVAGSWNAMPRIPRASATNDPVYRQVVAGILRRNGIVRPKINITQVLRVDLEGDGTEEVLISATHLAGGLGSAERSMAFRAQKGDYSLVVMRKIVRGRVRDVALIEEYFPKKVTDWVPNKHEVTGVLDLNGDAKMEVVVSIDYYEGSANTVFRIDGLKVTNVFGCGCGA